MQVIKHTILSVIVVILIAIVTLSCSEDEDVGLNNEDLIISTSYPVKISTYSYTDSLGSVFYVQGDTNYTLTPDTLNNRPTLAWDSIYTDLVSAAIFTNPIYVLGGEIKNTSDIIWQWHSGMEFEKISRIKYSEGKNVINGVIINRNKATPLSEGHYYWAVWGWNNSGIRILYSSRQREFYVTE